MYIFGIGGGGGERLIDDQCIMVQHRAGEECWVFRSRPVHCRSTGRRCRRHQVPRRCTRTPRECAILPFPWRPLLCRRLHAAVSSTSVGGAATPTQTQLFTGVLCTRTHTQRFLVNCLWCNYSTFAPVQYIKFKLIY